MLGRVPVATLFAEIQQEYSLSIIEIIEDSDAFFTRLFAEHLERLCESLSKIISFENCEGRCRAEDVALGKCGDVVRAEFYFCDVGEVK